jgi:prepilin-type N-terminal cleavage/methylation domain-containing protein
MKSVHNRTRGFSLIEMMLALALGAFVLGSTIMLYNRALAMSTTIAQRGEMQQNARTGLSMLSTDLSLAGAGMPTGGIQLPNGGGANPSFFGKDATQSYILNNTYPTGNYMNYVIPGPGSGMRTTGPGPNTDSTTIIYSDNTYTGLYQYPLTAMAADGSSITFDARTAPAITNAANGLTIGDLLLLSNNIGFAVGEVTSVNVNGTVGLANLDTLNVNQTGATGGKVGAITNGGCGAGPPIVPCINTTAMRILVITYYLDVPPGADNVRYTADDGPPRLMRQISGHPPVPVAENISDLQFTYDIFDTNTGIATANLKDAGMSLGKSPGQIRKINIWLTGRTPTYGSAYGTRGFQYTQLGTSVSARDMSFRDRYN